MYDLVVEGRILQEGSPVEVFLCIGDGLIKDIRRSTPGKGEMGEHHRFGGSLILPGVIDTHVHFRDPGLTKKEDFTTGSISAAFGGVTTVIDMPNTIPPTVDKGSLMEKDRIASRGSVIDYGLNVALVNSSSPEDIQSLLQGHEDAPSPVGVKAFLGESTGSLVLDPIDSLTRWGPILQRTRTTLSLHAEDGELFNEITDPGSINEVLRSHNASRPAIAESSAIRKANQALSLAAGFAHILHVSTKEGLEAAKAGSTTIEVTPHHLLMDMKWAERNLDNEAFVKVNPPIRTTEDRAALWEGINDGSILTMGSDHAPHLIEEKTMGLLSPSGMPGVETMLPLMLAEVVKKKMDLRALVQLLSIAPSQRFRINGKGRIQEGFEADLLIVDLKNGRKIRGENLHSKCGWTPYEDMIGFFPARVYSRGEMIVEDESLCSKVGRGRNIRA